MAATAAAATVGTPGPHYFVGTYERIGRVETAGGQLLDDRVRIEARGRTVAILGCSGAEVLLGFGPAFEMENLMTGAQAGVPVACLFHNNGYNRPILTCRVADGGAFTLWPMQDGPVECG